MDGAKGFSAGLRFGARPFRIRLGIGSSLRRRMPTTRATRGASISTVAVSAKTLSPTRNTFVSCAADSDFGRVAALWAHLAPADLTQQF